MRVHRTLSEVEAERGVAAWFYSLDFNERCPNVDTCWNSCGA